MNLVVILGCMSETQLKASCTKFFQPIDLSKREVFHFAEEMEKLWNSHDRERSQFIYVLPILPLTAKYQLMRKRK